MYHVNDKSILVLTKLKKVEKIKTFISHGYISGYFDEIKIRP